MNKSMINVCGLALLLLCYVCASSDAQDNSTLHRLPKNVWPESYDLLILSNVTNGNFTFKGQVVITLSVIETTNRVVLHAEKLKIDQENVTLRRIDSDEEDDADVRIKGQSYDEEAQFFTIELEASLLPGSYELSLRFDGSVLDDLFGFYRSSYKIGNETRWLGITQFSPTFARRAFPCFDEPGFKATFQLRLGHYDNETATSNSPEESNEIFGDDPSYHVTKFAETPRMSTYLLGWSIHSFQRINSSVDGRFSLWTRSRDLLLASSVGDASERVPLCLVEMPAIYSALENYTDLSNPIDKFDIFAVPDFNFQAMENWAFVTMRESVALISYEATSLRRIHGKLTSMGHELAHTWFGNLVTPFYWDVAWLKEAFATYFAYLAIGQVHEDWRMMDMFATEVLQDSLLLDSADHERRMNGPPLGTAAKAKAALDFVTYRKGSSIIRMISDLMGDEMFRDAIRAYLQDNQYEAVTPPDFYKSLEDTLIANNESFKYPVPFGEIIDSWANQSNYPVVQVSRIESGRLLLNQEIFKLDRGNESSTRPRQWWIPIKIVCAAGEDGYGIVQDLYWFEPSNSKEIDLPEGASENGWFILNPHQVGHYRVDYDPENWELLMSLLDSHDFKRLTGPTRAALVDDAFNLARADFQDYYLPLELIKYLTREDEYEPWLSASRAINLISRVLVDRPHVKLSFENYAKELMKPIYEKLTFDENPSDSYRDKILRNLILSTACALNLEDCVIRTKSIFDQWIAKDLKILPAYLKEIVYTVGVKHGNYESWMNLWQQFSEAELHSDQEQMMSALASTDEPLLINKYLTYAIDRKFDVPKQYRITIVQAVINGNSRNIDTTLQYLDINLDSILKIHGVDFLQSILSTIGEQATSFEHEKKIKSFILKHSNDLNNTADANEKIVQSMRNNILWIERCSNQIFEYFNWKE
ncbi:hypothetical protein TKK_0017243 [Trichogramma kaykai]|uniref:Aminopeptidase n=1 Tax=Trichogramma kaykai TaxID=54128 RepID=A0ABD2W5V3_9HYME